MFFPIYELIRLIADSIEFDSTVLIIEFPLLELPSLENALVSVNWKLTLILLFLAESIPIAITYAKLSILS